MSTFATMRAIFRIAKFIGTSDIALICIEHFRLVYDGTLAAGTPLDIIHLIIQSVVDVQGQLLENRRLDQVAQLQ